MRHHLKLRRGRIRIVERGSFLRQHITAEIAVALRRIGGDQRGATVGVILLRHDAAEMNLRGDFRAKIVAGIRHGLEPRNVSIF